MNLNEVLCLINIRRYLFIILKNLIILNGLKLFLIIRTSFVLKQKNQKFKT